MRNLFLILLLLLAACSNITPKQNVVKQSIEKKIATFNVKHVEVKVGEVRNITLPLISLFSAGEVICKGKAIPSYKDDSGTHFFIRETYFSKQEGYACQWKNSTGKQIKIIEVNIAAKEFPSERLMVDKKRVTLSKKSLKRVAKEQKMLNKIYASFHPRPYFSKPFLLPINSKVTSIYGARRIYNNHKQGQHLGTDFRAKIGEDIKVTNRGRVVVARDLFFTGGTVTVDHGMGIFTVYGHLSKILVSKGDLVNRGDLVGLSGVSGRVTGPHLHWGIKIQGEWIDGMSLISTSKYLLR